MDLAACAGAASYVVLLFSCNGLFPPSYPADRGFSDIGAACWMSGRLSVCDVPCGNSPQEAMTQARARCKEKQQHGCPITATVPVAGL
jgi:hypothetical protein